MCRVRQWPPPHVRGRPQRIRHPPYGGDEIYIYPAPVAHTETDTHLRKRRAVMTRPPENYSRWSCSFLCRISLVVRCHSSSVDLWATTQHPRFISCPIIPYSTGHLLVYTAAKSNRKAGPGWISYSRKGAVWTLLLEQYKDSRVSYFPSKLSLPSWFARFFTIY